MKSKGIDFCSGNIVKQLLLFSIPIVMGELLQNLYNSADAIVVGNFVSKQALAAVSICVGPSDLMVGFFNGMSMGSSVVVAQSFGLHDREKLLRAMRVSFTFSVIFGVLVSLLGQGLEPLEAAACAAWLHGKAGDLCAGELGEYGMLPTDLLDFLPRLLK